MNRNIIFWFGVLGVVLFVGCTLYGAGLIDGYSHWANYISESYARGIPGAEPLRYGFIFGGIFLALFAFFLPRFLPKSGTTKVALLGIAIFYGLGTAITGIFPCDPGCPETVDGISLSQFTHNISGALAYLITPISLVIIAVSIRKATGFKKVTMVTALCAFVALLGVMILFSDPTSNYRGFVQRLIEASILFWFLYIAFWIKGKNKGP